MLTVCSDVSSPDVSLGMKETQIFSSDREEQLLSKKQRKATVED